MAIPIDFASESLHWRSPKTAQGENQQKHYSRHRQSSTIMGTVIGVVTGTRLLRRFMAGPAPSNSGEAIMSGQVILYFDDQADALRFALAAGSVMAGDEARATGDLVHETTRVTRILLDDPIQESAPAQSPDRAA